MRKIKNMILSVLFLLVIGVVPKVYAADVYVPLSVTGFNADVVAESLDNVADTIGVEDGHVYIASSFDPSKPADSKGFFPGDRIITTTTGRKYYIQPTTSNNSLKLTSGGQYSGAEAGSLIVTTTNKYEKIGILTTGGGGNINLTVEVEYQDGTKTSKINIIAYDWYGGYGTPDIETVYHGLWRLARNSTNYLEDSVSGMYEYTIDVDSTKIIKQLNFEYVGNGAAGNIFAISGVIDSEKAKTVIFKYNDSENKTEEVNLLQGEKVAKPTDPTRNRYDFGGWYSDAELTQEYNFDTPVNDNITLYAKWNETEDIGIEIEEPTKPNTNDAKIDNTTKELKEIIPFTESELEALESGKDISIYLEVKDVSETIPEDDKEKVNETLTEKEEVAMYLDVSLFKQVEGEEAVRVTELNKPMTISFVLPEELINKDSSIERKYVIYLIHDDEVSKVEVKVNGNIATFETDRFSTYVLTYSDSTKSISNPKTSDNLIFYLTVALISVYSLIKVRK